MKRCGEQLGDWWHSSPCCCRAVPLVAALLFFVRVFPWVAFDLIGRPSAFLAGCWLAERPRATVEGLLLVGGPLPTLVSPACSAGDFFAIVIGVLLTTAAGWRGTVPRWEVLPVAYGVTVLSNSCRILAAVYVGAWSRAALPQVYWGAFHLATGVLVFCCALVLTRLVAISFERRSAP